SKEPAPSVGSVVFHSSWPPGPSLTTTDTDPFGANPCPWMQSNVTFPRMRGGRFSPLVVSPSASYTWTSASVRPSTSNVPVKSTLQLPLPSDVVSRPAPPDGPLTPTNTWRFGAVVPETTSVGGSSTSIVRGSR